MTDGLSGAVHHRKMAQATTLTSITYVSPVLLLSVVVPHFHPYAGVVFFYSWLCHKFALVFGLGVGLDLV